MERNIISFDPLWIYGGLLYFHISLVVRLVGFEYEKKYEKNLKILGTGTAIVVVVNTSRNRLKNIFLFASLELNFFFRTHRH